MTKPTYEIDPACPVCAHPERAEIDAELAAMHRAGVGLQGEIARRYGPENTLTTWDVLVHDRHRRARPEAGATTGADRLRYGALYDRDTR